MHDSNVPAAAATNTHFTVRHDPKADRQVLSHSLSLSLLGTPRSSTTLYLEVPKLSTHTIHPQPQSRNAARTLSKRLLLLHDRPLLLLLRLSLRLGLRLPALTGVFWQAVAFMRGVLQGVSDL